jgi:hypothetical protein
MNPSGLVDFIYKLFFTRDDDLDILQVLFAIIIFVTLFVVWEVSLNDLTPATVKVEGLITLRWLTGLLVVTAVPKWLVPVMSKQVKALSQPAPAPANVEVIDTNVSD